MKYSQWTDFFRSIRKSLGRYVSLIFIVALGTAFFTGIRSAEPNMLASADKYYDESALMDVRILGTLGLTEEDVEAISRTDGIQNAEGGYSTEVLAVVSDDKLSMSVMSPCEKMNQMTIWEGRMPEKPDECFMDAGLMIAKGYEIGDTIVLTDEDGTTPDHLKTDSFTIVGKGTWSWYLSWSRGSSSIGDGTLDAFMIVPEEAFDMDYYTVIYAMVQNVQEMNSFSDAYEEAVDLVVDRIEEIAGERCEVRYSQIYEDAQQVLQDARDEITENEQKLHDAEQELLDAEQAYTDGVKTYEDSQKEYEKGLEAYRQGERDLAAAKNQLDAARREYEAGSAALLNGQAEYDRNVQQLEEERQKLAAAEAEAAKGQAAYDEAAAQLNAAKAQLQEKETELSGQWETYNGYLAQYQEKEAQLQEVKQNLDALNSEIAQLESRVGELEKQMDQVAQEQGTDSEAYQDLEKQKAELEQQIPQKKQEAASMQEQYDQATPELAEQKKQLDANKAQLDQAQAELDGAKADLAAKEQELAQQKAVLDDAKRQIQEGHAAADAAQLQLNAASQQLEQSRDQLMMADQQIDYAREQYAKGEAELAENHLLILDAQKQLEEGQEELLDARQKLDDGWQEYREATKEAEDLLNDAKKEIADGEEELSKLEKGEWYVLGRDSVQTKVEYSLDAERIGAIGKVLPVIFFLVAALVSLTTMTRMIEEERTLIGTMKALGYGKFSISLKYILYAFSATLIGGLLGVTVGSKVLPYVIMIAYSMLYSNIQYKVMPLHPGLCASSIGLAMLCTVGAAYFACYKELRSTPASLMRPPAPKVGKRVLLERIPGIWSHMNFSMKATVRNLMRYKKRFFMTVFGIGGCMAILLACFGLRDSISVIAERQYENIWTYSAACGLEEKQDRQDQKKLSEDMLQEEPQIRGTMLARLVSADVSTDLAEKNVMLYVLNQGEDLQQYFDFHMRGSEYQLQFSDVGVILTEKLANTLGVNAGDSFTMDLSGRDPVEVRVAAVTENYMNHCVYMTPELYEQLYGEAPAWNQLFLSFEEGLSEEQQLAIAERTLGREGVVSIMLVGQMQDALNDMITALNLVVWVLIISAGLLAFVVLFNLNNINISERRREMASLKVLGFYDMEVAMYVYRENLFLTIFGIVLGLLLGSGLHTNLINTLEVDLIMFGRDVEPISYVYSVLLTILFTVLVNISMYYKLKKIDMIESLKSVE